MNVSPDSIRRVGESDLLDLARIARGTWNGWARSGHIDPPDDGLFDESDVVHATVLNLLSDVVSMTKAVVIWDDCGEVVTRSCLALALDGSDALDLVLDLQTLRSLPVSQADELFDVIHAHVPSPRGWVVIPLAELIREARDGFWRRARPASEFESDKRRKSATQAKQQRQKRDGG